MHTKIYNTAKQAQLHHILTSQFTDWPLPLTICKCNLASCHVVLSLMADGGLMGCYGGGLVLCSARHIRWNSISFTQIVNYITSFKSLQKLFLWLCWHQIPKQWNSKILILALEWTVAGSDPICSKCAESCRIRVLKSGSRTPLRLCSVEHDPVSGSRSNMFLQFRTGPGSDWIS